MRAHLCPQGSGPPQVRPHDAASRWHGVLTICLREHAHVLSTGTVHGGQSPSA